MRTTKGQISIELMTIIAFVVLLFIPLVLFVYYKTSELNAGIEGMESRLISSKLAFMANALGSMGDENALKAEISLPPSVRTLEFKNLTSGGEVLVTLTDGSQISQITIFPFKYSKYSGGASYKLEFVSQGGAVSVAQSS